jgi:hypothetical protein
MTMKWSNRIAQGLSPGSTSPKTALKAFPTPRTRGAIPTWRSTPILHRSAWPDSRTRTKRLTSTLNPLRGCNSGKALLIGLTLLFCKQQRSSTSTSAEPRTPNAKRLVSGDRVGRFLPTRPSQTLTPLITMLSLIQHHAFGRYFRAIFGYSQPRAKALGYSVRAFSWSRPAAAHKPPTTNH